VENALGGAKKAPGKWGASVHGSASPYHALLQRTNSAKFRAWFGDSKKKRPAFAGLFFSKVAASIRIEI